MDIRQEATNIDRNYGKVVANFLALVDSDLTLSKVRKHFKRFSSKYAMIPSLWIKWLELEGVDTFPDFNASTSKQRIEKIKVAAKKHFLHNEFEDNKGGHFDANIFVHIDFNTIFEISMQNPTSMKPLEKALLFPHFGIKNTKTYCELFGTQPLPTAIIQRYKRSKIIADLFENEEGIRQEWFQEVIKCLDKVFIIKSFEYALGIYPQCYDAWKLYISYLKKINAKFLMLTVYSKCCRLFIDDLEIWKKYLKKVKEINAIPKNVTKWRIDIIEGQRRHISNASAKTLLAKILKLHSFPDDEEFVRYVQWFKSCKDKTKMQFLFYLPEIETEIEMPKKINKSENLFYIKPQIRSPTYFSEDGLHKQLFSLPYNYVNYLEIYSSSKNLQKLFQTCKYFFSKIKTPLCHRLGIFKENLEARYYSQSLFLNLETLNFGGLKNLIVTNLFQVHFYDNQNIVSSILSNNKITFEISHLILLCQTLTEKEFDLISGEKIKSVTLNYVTVYDFENIPLLIIKLIKKFPKAFSICLNYESQTFEEDFIENLATLDRKRNLSRIQLAFVPQTFNVNFFFFIKKFLLPNAKIVVHFYVEVDQDVKNMFESHGNMMLKGTNADIEIL